MKVLGADMFDLNTPLEELDPYWRGDVKGRLRVRQLLTHACGFLFEKNGGSVLSGPHFDDVRERLAPLEKISAKATLDTLGRDIVLP